MYPSKHHCRVAGPRLVAWNRAEKPYNDHMVCYKHPKAETAVRCSKCDRPICPRCMVSSPVGMRCADCASLRGTALYRIHPARLILATVVALAVGIAGAFVLTMISFFVFFVGPIYGGIVAEGVLRAAGRKRGRALEVIGIGSIIAGAAVTMLPRLAVLLHPGAVMGIGGIGMLWPLVGFVLAISTCFTRLKYW